MHAEQLVFPFAAGWRPVPLYTAGCCRREAYKCELLKRYHGAALKDAWRNWQTFSEIRHFLRPALVAFVRDRYLETVGGQMLNPDGTLTRLLWNLQPVINPDPASLWPLLDFEEHFQKVFLRRGLVIYCGLVLRDLEAKEAAA